MAEKLITFSTPDAQFAAFLQVTGRPLKDLANEHKKGRRCYFIFEMTQEDWDRCNFDYLTGSEGSLVQAQEYAKAIKSMDTLLRNRLNSFKYGK
jgi:hypothetical protein